MRGNKFIVGVTNYTFLPYHHACAIDGLAARKNCDFPGLGPVLLKRILDFAHVDYEVRVMSEQCK